MSTSKSAEGDPDRAAAMRRNVVVQLREAYTVLNDLAPQRLVERGFIDFRPSHSRVFEHLDETGTTVSVLAERARMTKQAMAELVAHLEERGYLRRVPDPEDGRAKLVMTTDRGREVFRVAQDLAPELHARLARAIGPDRFEQLRDDLDLICREFDGVQLG